jgi:hypothetical protein
MVRPLPLLYHNGSSKQLSKPLCCALAHAWQDVRIDVHGLSHGDQLPLFTRLPTRLMFSETQSPFLVILGKGKRPSSYNHSTCLKTA